MAIGGQLPEYLTPPHWLDKQAVSRDVALGAEIVNRARQVQQENRRIALQEQALQLKQEAQTHLSNGALALGSVMAEGARNNSYADQAWERKFWDTATRYPQLMDSDVFKGMRTVVENAKSAKHELKMLETRLADERTPADVVKLQYLATFDEKIAQAEAMGDTDTATKIREASTLLKGTMLAPQETVETFTDDQGRPGFRIVRGGPASKAAGALTVATQTEIQKRQLGYTKSMGMAKTLLNVLKPQNVGVLGAGQQIIVDEGLAQVIPELASQQNVDSRTLLRVFNETMLKTLKADSQLNQKEEQRILAALPKTGANESFPGAVAKIVRALTELHSMAATDAKTAGLPEPAFPLDPQTLRELVMTKKLDADIGVSLLQKYYPNFQLKP